jgi:hypothetical protein
MARPMRNPRNDFQTNSQTEVGRQDDSNNPKNNGHHSSPFDDRIIKGTTCPAAFPSWK